MRILLAAAIPLLIAGVPGHARADFQYQSTSRVTGGTLLQMMRFVPGGGKLKEPQVSTVAVQGNRMVRRSKRQAEIIDLDKRTITNVDFEKHTITEMTFDQMKQALDQATQQLQAAKSQPDAANAGPDSAPNNVNLNFDADIKSTGQTKTVNGLDAQQFIVTMSMAASDPQSGQSGAMKITSEMWIAKEIPGANELRDFQRRMAKELDWAPTGMGNMLNRPDVNQALGKMMAEGGKMEGTPIQQVIRIGGEATGMPSDQAQQQSQPAPPKPSVSDAVGSALGSRLGGFGGFGRKKQNTSPDTSSNAQPPTQQGSQQVSGSLMEMTVDSSGFSTAAVDASLFEIPADFKEVEPSLPGTTGK